MYKVVSCKQYAPRLVLKWIADLTFKIPHAFSTLNKRLGKTENPTKLKRLLQICFHTKALRIYLVQSCGRGIYNMTYRSLQPYRSLNNRFPINTSSPCMHTNACDGSTILKAAKARNSFTVYECY